MASIDGLFIDVARYRPLLVVSEPAPKIDFESKQPKKDRDGNVIWVVGLALVRMDGTKASVIDVSLTSELIGLTYGVPVHVEDLVVSSWEMERDRWGFTYKAASITALPVGSAHPAPAAAAPAPVSGPVRAKPGAES